ncbi:N-6 DNA methylase [Streptomyces griseoincarnatus]
MRDDTGSAAAPLVTGAEVARLAGVTRAAVSNWRRRYDDFPAPVSGGAGTPLFSLPEVRAWLAKQRKGQDLSDDVRLWQALRGAYGDDMVSGLALVSRFLTRGTEPGLDPALSELLTQLAARESAADVIKALTERFLDSARRAGSDQVTSPRVVRAVSRFVPPLPEGGSVFDPACGIGSLLFAVGPLAGSRHCGQELDPSAAEFAQLRAGLIGLRDVSVTTGDSLRSDSWLNLRADLVVCDPPVAEPDWGREELLLDSRWELGTPSRAEGELAWLQHCYAHTAPGGHVLIVMPASVAYRKAGRRIRAEMVRRGILSQVVALPPGTAASHKLPVHLWLLRRPSSPSDAVSVVRMVDLTANDPEELSEPAPEQVVDVPLVELLDDIVDLTPGSHVRAWHRDYSAEYRAIREEIEEQLSALAKLLPVLGAEGDGDSLDSATVSLADLSRAGLVDLGDDGPTSTSEQLDEDYLQGFLRSTANMRRSTSSSGTFRLDARGARIPQMAIGEQRRYGAAFRLLQEFEERVKKVSQLGEQAASLARDGLTSGALTPPREDD